MSQKLGAAMYAEQQAAPPGADGEAAGQSADGGSDGSDDDVVDAEIVDEDTTPEGESK